MISRESISIKNFDMIETTALLSKITGERYDNEKLEPILILSLNSSELPWNYEQWDLKSISYTRHEVVFEFKHCDNIYPVLILDDNFDLLLYNNLCKYKNVIVNISNDKKEDLSFYMKINQ